MKRKRIKKGKKKDKKKKATSQVTVLWTNYCTMHQKSARANEAVVGSETSFIWNLGLFAMVTGKNLILYKRHTPNIFLSVQEPYLKTPSVKNIAIKPQLSNTGVVSRVSLVHTLKSLFLSHQNISAL